MSGKSHGISSSFHPGTQGQEHIADLEEGFACVKSVAVIVGGSVVLKPSKEATALFSAF
jgi:hypothetical protein